MPIPTDKPPRVCPYCSKEVAGLATHIINQHPSIIEKLEEGTQKEITPGTNSSQISRPIPQNMAVFRSTREILNEAFESMLQVKLIQMMQANPNLSIQDLNSVINPVPQQSFTEKLEEMAKLKTLLGGNTTTDQINNNGSDGSEWISLINNGLPIVQQLLANRQHNKTEENKNVTEYRELEKGSTAICGLIPEETPGDPREPSDLGKEPGDPGKVEQFHSAGIKRLN